VTLAQLEEVTSKYRDALCEIADLSAQISEAKLNSDTSEVGSEAGSCTVPHTLTVAGRALAAKLWMG